MDTSRLKKLAYEIKQKQQIERSLETARHRQRCMLPTVPKMPGFEFHFYYSPATNVSGDFCDFIPVKEGVIGLALGDVAGHGIEAGIIMGMAKKALQIYAKDRVSPKDTLCVLNLDLAKDLDTQTFISASYGVLDAAALVFRFARAGHTPLYLVNPARTPVLTECKPNGMVIGVDKTGKHFPIVMQESVIPLQKGDLLFQYTDGVAEAPNGDGVEFGEERLKELLTKLYPAGLAEMLMQIEEAVRAHTGAREQEDDITMMVVRVQ